MTDRYKLSADFDKKDYDRVIKLACENNISRAEVVRRGVKFALIWKKQSFWCKVKKCFFGF